MGEDEENADIAEALRSFVQEVQERIAAAGAPNGMGVLVFAFSPEGFAAAASNLDDAGCLKAIRELASGHYFVDDEGRRREPTGET